MAAKRPKIMWFKDKSECVKTKIIRLIPQGTVGNNLGPNRLAGAKALDPNHCRHPTL